MSLDQGAVDAIAELGRRTAADTTIPIGTGEYLDNTVTAATTGKGKVEVPERFSVRMSPFLGAEQVQITARLRYRIDAGSGLRIGYTLQRPDIAEREAFEAILAGIDGGLPEGVPILLGTAPEALR